MLSIFGIVVYVQVTDRERQMLQMERSPSSLMRINGPLVYMYGQKVLQHYSTTSLKMN